MRPILILLPLLALCGCLTTTKPVFTAENSVPAAQSQRFMAYVDLWEAFAGPEDSPRDVTRDGSRVMDLDGQVLIEEIKADDSVEYYSISAMGHRPVGCFAHDGGIEDIAARHGVTVTTARAERDYDVSPVPIMADGSTEALRAFVLEVFNGGSIVCFSPPRQGG